MSRRTVLRPFSPVAGSSAIRSGQTIAEQIEEAMLSTRLSFPVLPGVVATIIEEVNRPGSSSRSVGEMVQADPAISARILRIANSAAYGGLTGICDLSRAISRMGSALVVAVVIGCASKETFRCEHPHLLVVAENAWSRSIKAAPFGRLLASRMGVDPGLAFMGGLLHCTGITVLVQLIESLSAAVKSELPRQPELEVVLQELAPAAGALLLESWKLPEMVIEAIRHQACPASASPAFEPLARLIGAASDFAVAAMKGDANEIVERLAAKPSMAGVAEDADDLLTLVLEGQDHSSELRRLFT